MAQKMKIMAAVDLSEFSAAAVRYSVWLAKKLDAELVLVSVVSERDVDMVQRAMTGYETFSYPKFLIEQVREHETIMNDLLSAASPGTLECKYRVKNGIPHRELLAAIDEEKPNLMVLSTKGRSNMADVVVGSTARKMYRRSPIPLVTIPAGYNEIP